MSGDDRLRKLLERLKEGAELPKSALGRARRTAGAALKVGLGRLRGKDEIETMAELAVSMGELKGIAMKAGQILSYLDTELPDEAKRLLAVLQVSSQPTPFAEIERVLREDGLSALLETIQREPVSTASIGQVHRATLPDGTAVAVKVRHPGIEQAMAADFRTAAAGSFLPNALVPGVNIAEVIGEVRETLLAECDYAAEARHQQRFVELYAGHPSITIPAVHPKWCSPRVLVTTWCDGLTFEQFVTRGTQPARDRGGAALYEFYVGSVYRHGLFNADPHPGNLLFREDGSLIVLDFGCVREFERPLVRALGALSRSVRADELSAIRQALLDLGAAPDEKGMAVTRTLLRGFFGPVLVAGPHRVESGLSLDTRELLRDKLAIARMRLPPKLLFLLRIRFGLHSELKRLGSVADWSGLEERLVAAV